MLARLLRRFPGYTLDGLLAEDTRLLRVAALTDLAGGA